LNQQKVISQFEMNGAHLTKIFKNNKY